MDAGVEPEAAVLPAARLVLLTAPTIELAFNEKAMFRVRYEEDADGRPIAGGRLGLSLRGTSNGSSLSTLQVTTDGDGEAEAEITAGNVAGIFGVRVTAERAQPIVIDVAVSNLGFGNLDVTARYRGARRAGARRIGVSAGLECGPGGRPPDVELDRTRLIVEDETGTVFRTLPAGLVYGVVARYESASGTVIAEGCIDGLAIEADLTTTTVVNVMDLPLVPDGLYETTLELDVSASAAKVEEALVAAAVQLIAASGGDTGYLLDGITRELEEAQNLSAVAALNSMRSSGDLEQALEMALSAAARGPSHGADRVGITLRERLSLLRVDGEIEIDNGLSYRPEGVWIRPAQPGGSWMTLDVAGEEGLSGMLLGPLDPSGESLEVEALVTELSLGAVGRAALTALREEAAAAGAIDLLVEEMGCAEATESLATSTELVAACDEACLEMACREATSQLAEDVGEALVSLDEANLVRLRGTLSLTDDDGDLKPDTMFSDELAGEWSNVSGTLSEPTTATATAERAEPIP